MRNLELEHVVIEAMLAILKKVTPEERFNLLYLLNKNSEPLFNIMGPKEGDVFQEPMDKTLIIRMR